MQGECNPLALHVETVIKVWKQRCHVDPGSVALNRLRKERMLVVETFVAIVKRNEEGQWAELNEVHLERDEEITILQSEKGLIAVVGFVGESDMHSLEGLVRDLSWAN